MSSQKKAISKRPKNGLHQFSPASSQEESSPWKLLIVDDDIEMHELTRMVLRDFKFEGRGLYFLSAFSAEEAKAVLASNPDIAVILLDIVMETDDAGLLLVKHIREELNQHLVRIILRTGQPGQAPEQEVVTNFDIHDYKEKTELTAQKLFTSVIASLRSYRDLCTIEEHRKALHEKSLINQLILDALPCVALLLTDDGYIIACNEPAKSMGFLPNISFLTACTDNEDGIATWSRIPAALKNNKRQSWEDLSNETPYELHWIPLGNGQNLCYAFDISERKKAEAKKQELEAQLRHSHKLETIGTLAGGIAHDFNNILTPIMGYTDMALETTDPNTQAYVNLKHVLNAAVRAKELVQQILTFSRQTEQERSPVEIHLIVAEAVKLLRSSLPTTIEIHRHIDKDCGKIMADATQIHQVLMNLCTNAFHAMRANGGLLEVSLQKVEIDNLSRNINQNLRPGKYVCLTVSDNGCGMDPKVKERIFEPFFTTKDVDEGTGLGLSVVHGIVMSHGGDITVDSKPEKGSTFKVFFPCLEKETEKTSSKEEVKLKGGDESILLVDDEEVIVQMVEQALKYLGYKIEVITSSEEALELVRKNPDKFDLVITDQTMPRMTGIMLSRELCQIKPGLPILLVTGSRDLVLRNSITEYGISDYVLKPLVINDLNNAIRRVLDMRKKKNQDK